MHFSSNHEGLQRKLIVYDPMLPLTSAERALEDVPRKMAVEASL